jgi:hypothetical protein
MSCNCSCGPDCQCGDNCNCGPKVASPTICDCSCGPDCQCPPGKCTCPKASSVFDFAQDGPEALRIASVIPYYPFHGVPRFYDISGINNLNLIIKLLLST